MSKMNKSSNKNTITLVIGGCRSGKSSHALNIANQMADSIKCRQAGGSTPSAIEKENDIEKENNIEKESNIKKENNIENNVDHQNGTKKIFMATSVPTDQEMEERVSKHKLERGNDWLTAEVPVELPSQIMELSPASDLILVDCLTLWVSNLMFHEFDEEGIFRMTRQLQDALHEASSPVFLVSNEVGMGIVPENALGRQFRDMAGYVNQKIAHTSDQVIYMVAGIPWRIKPATCSTYH